MFGIMGRASRDQYFCLSEQHISEFRRHEDLDPITAQDSLSCFILIKVQVESFFDALYTIDDVVTVHVELFGGRGGFPFVEEIVIEQLDVGYTPAERGLSNQVKLRVVDAEVIEFTICFFFVIIEKEAECLLETKGSPSVNIVERPQFDIDAGTVFSCQTGLLVSGSHVAKCGEMIREKGHASVLIAKLREGQGKRFRNISIVFLHME